VILLLGCLGVPSIFRTRKELLVNLCLGCLGNLVLYKAQFLVYPLEHAICVEFGV
jgi:hypothetical protein